METQQKPTPQSEEERLKNMSEEERLKYLATLDSEQRQAALNILQSILSAGEWESFSVKYEASQSSNNYLQSANSPRPSPTTTSSDDQDRQLQWEEDRLRKSREEQELKRLIEKEQQSGQAKQQAPAPVFMSFFPPKAPKPEAEVKAKPSLESLSSDIQAIMNSRPAYKTEFSQYDDQFRAGNKIGLHDADSSVPFRGQVMPSGQTAFAIKQGEKLEDLLNKQHISPLNASPADQAVLKRASAARYEEHVQWLGRSESAAMDSERKFMRSIEDFRNGALAKALPDLQNAKSSSDIKAVLETAMSNGQIKPNEIQAGMRNIGNAFKEYSAAIKSHTGNLAKDGQDSAAQDWVQKFVGTSEKANKLAFLDEINDTSFTERMQEMSRKMAEAIRELVNSLFSGPSKSPQPA